MKDRLMFTLLALLVLAITNTSSFAGQDKKEKSCAGGCCSGEKMAMAGEQPMHNHHSTTVASDTVKGTVRYTCKMHPKVISDKPDDCPKCGMELVAVYEHSKDGMKEMPTEQKHDTSKMMAKKHSKMMMDMKHDSTSMDKKFALMKARKYHCCIEGACDECVSEGECDCKNAVEKGESVCNECYEGWKRGDGDVSGKTFKDIKKEDEHKH